MNTPEAKALAVGERVLADVRVRDCYDAAERGVACIMLVQRHVPLSSLHALPALTEAEKAYLEGFALGSEAMAESDDATEAIRWRYKLRADAARFYAAVSQTKEGQ